MNKILMAKMALEIALQLLDRIEILFKEYKQEKK